MRVRGRIVAQNIAVALVQDLIWFDERKEMLWGVARHFYAEQGRGAVVVNTTLAHETMGHPFAYASQSMLTLWNDVKTHQMVDEYDPDAELVIVFLKPGPEVSSYRINVTQQNWREDAEESG